MAGIIEGARPGCNIRAIQNSTSDLKQDNLKLDSSTVKHPGKKTNLTGAAVHRETLHKDSLEEPPMANDLPSRRQDKLDVSDFDYERCYESHIKDGGFPGTRTKNKLDVDIQLWDGGPIFNFTLVKDPNNEYAYRGWRQRYSTGQWRIGDLNFIQNEFGELAG